MCMSQCFQVEGSSNWNLLSFSDSDRHTEIVTDILGQRETSHTQPTKTLHGSTSKSQNKNERDIFLVCEFFNIETVTTTLAA